MRLAPKAGEAHKFHANDRLVVISESKFDMGAKGKKR